MAGLVPATSFLRMQRQRKTWMTGTKAGQDEGRAYFWPIVPSVPACNRLMFSRWV
jgi:hypothetical protein